MLTIYDACAPARILRLLSVVSQLIYSSAPRAASRHRGRLRRAGQPLKEHAAKSSFLKSIAVLGLCAFSARREKDEMNGRYLWLVFGFFATGCAIIGAVLPLVPT